MSGKVIKQIPYGVSDFEKIQKKESYYVDKTHFIRVLENLGDFLFLIRPRRFGKSLLLSMLQSYYDIANKDQFEEVFKDTAILDNPTDERNSYLILKLNFSEVNPGLDKVADSFESCTNNSLNVFLRTYEQYFEKDFLQSLYKHNYFADKFGYLSKYCSLKKLKLYILLDEYDNFANTILTSFGKEQYHDLTHGPGFFRYFFNMLKAATTGSDAAVSRMFITGVSPVTMDDVTSGFNIGTLVSLDSEVNELLGLTEEEVRTMLKYYIAQGLIESDKEQFHYEIMSKWYDNYRFSKDSSDKRMFNTDMVLYYVRDIIKGRMPDNLVDRNVKTDYKKLRHFIMLDKKIKNIEENNFSTLMKIIETEQIEERIIDSFPVESLRDKDKFVSLLYYFGLLSIESSELNTCLLKVPNLTIKSLYYEYFREALKDADMFEIPDGALVGLFKDMALKGQWQQVFDYLADQINKQTSIRDFLKEEKIIQGFLLAYLNMTSDVYIIQSEYEANKHYTDLYFQPFIGKYGDEIKYSYLMELKYLKREANDSAIDPAVKEAREQLLNYEKDDIVQKTKGNTQLKKVLLVFKGWELVAKEEV